MMTTDGMAKIRQKSYLTPKQFKRGPGPEGAARLRQRANALQVAARRLARKATTSAADQAFALDLADRLKAAVEGAPLAAGAEIPPL